MCFEVIDKSAINIMPVANVFKCFGGKYDFSSSLKDINFNANVTVWSQEERETLHSSCLSNTCLYSLVSTICKMYRLNFQRSSI